MTAYGRHRAPGPIKTFGQSSEGGSTPPSEFVSDTRHASPAALEAAFSAASHGGKFGLVDDGPSGDPQTYQSNGISWEAVITGGGLVDTAEISDDPVVIGDNSSKMISWSNDAGNAQPGAVIDIAITGPYAVSIDSTGVILPGESVDCQITVTSTGIQSGTLTYNSTDASAVSVAVTSAATSISDGFLLLALGKGAQNGYDFDGFSDKIGAWGDFVPDTPGDWTTETSGVPTAAGGVGITNAGTSAVMTPTGFDRQDDLSIVCIVRGNTTGGSFDALWGSGVTYNDQDAHGHLLHPSTSVRHYIVSNGTAVTGINDWFVAVVTWSVADDIYRLHVREKDGSVVTEPDGSARTATAAVKDFYLGASSGSFSTRDATYAGLYFFKGTLLSTSDVEDFGLLLDEGLTA